MRGWAIFHTLLAALLLAIAGAGASAWAGPFPEPGQPCNVPFCAANASVNHFSEFSMADRRTEVARIRAAYPAETAPAPQLTNIVEFLRLTLAIPSTGRPGEAEWRADATDYRNAALFQALMRSEMSTSIDEPGILGSFFYELTDLSRKRQVLARWAPVADSRSERTDLQKLVSLFFLMRNSAERAGDPAPFVAELRSAELSAAARLNRLFPPPPVRDPDDGGAGELDPACGLPVCDVAAETERFRSLAPGPRYLQSQALRLAWQDATNLLILSRMAELGRSLSALFRSLGEQPWTIGMADGILSDALSGLLKFSPAREPAKLVAYFNELSGEGPRFQALGQWRARINTLSDRDSLVAVETFFAAVALSSQAARDPDYITREAQTGLSDVRDRLRQLFPPAPPQETCLLGACDIAAEVTRLRGLGQGDRFQVIQRLSGKAARSTDSAWLLQTARLARAIEALFKEIREEEWMTREAVSLRSSAYFALLRSAAPVAATLLEYFGGMQGETPRFQGLNSWRLRVAALTSLSELAELKSFFTRAADLADSQGEPDYVGREGRMAAVEVDERVARIISSAGSPR